MKIMMINKLCYVIIMSSTEKSLQFIPQSLRMLLQGLFVGQNTELKVTRP